jgi:hypothetical protein
VSFKPKPLVRKLRTKTLCLPQATIQQEGKCIHSHHGQCRCQLSPWHGGSSRSTPVLQLYP